MTARIKIVWICCISNEQIREHLQYSWWTPLAILKRIKGIYAVNDYAQWNTNAICEFEKFPEVELHVISSHNNICRTQQFQIRGIHYHFFESEDDTIVELIKRKFHRKVKNNYVKNTKKILQLINIIKPDIIHVIGAENPSYGESVLCLPPNIPLIVSLQTLMSDPAFFDNYPISKESYDYRSRIEKGVISKADYIASKGELFRKIIREKIKPNARFLDMSLAVGETVTIEDYTKKYDFVYFAAEISKAIDYAVESFALAQKKHPMITLHVVGGYDANIKAQIDARITELGLTGIDFTGKLSTHDDVINEIRKARFALIPLKIDIVSGTIREAMANGLPVVSNITPGTPKLNENRESILLSDKADHQGMADNMCRLIEDADLVKQIQQNAILTMNERYSNATAMKIWVENYKLILKEKN